jgi:putative phage-type endonuclease
MSLVVASDSEEVIDTEVRRRWLEDRRKAIGASDVAAVLRLSPWACEWEVWADKRGMIEFSADTPATSAGKTLEPAVLDHAERQLGKLFRDVRISHDSLPLAATCDAIVLAGRRPVEAKTTGIVGPIVGHWGDQLTDQVPDHYLVQVQAQLMCTKSDLAYLFALLPGRGFVEYQIEPCDRLHEYLGNYLSDWWQRHVVQGVEPSIQDTVPSLDVVKRLRKTSGKSIDADESIGKLTCEWERAKAVALDSKKRAEELQSRLLIAINDAESVNLPDGRLMTNLEQENKGYTVEPYKCRVLRIKKGK